MFFFPFFFSFFSRFALPFPFLFPSFVPHSPFSSSSFCAHSSIGIVILHRICRAIQMADEFEDVVVTGVDLAPIQPEYVVPFSFLPLLPTLTLTLICHSSPTRYYHFPSIFVPDPHPHLYTEWSRRIAGNAPSSAASFAHDRRFANF